MTLVLRQRRDQLQGALRALETVGPSATLERGYAILSRDSDGTVVRTPEAVEAGDALSARVAGGKIPLSVRRPSSDG